MTAMLAGCALAGYFAIMTIDAIREARDTTPFRRFVIRRADGPAFEAPNHDSVLVAEKGARPIVRTLLVILAAVCLAGCGKKNAKSTEGGNPLNAPADYLGAVSQAKKVAEKTVDVASIQNAVNLFQAQEDRYPKSLDELVKQHYLQRVPEAPAGMKLTYNPANGEVKMLRQ